MNVLVDFHHVDHLPWVTVLVRMIEHAHETALFYSGDYCFE